jgi:adenine phosphoribosyltransferase
VVILDDLLATGGTMNASVELLRRCGAEVSAAACIIELRFLNGRDKLDIPVHSLISYDS